MSEVVEFVNMGIGDVVSALRSGERVRRKGWNGKGLWLAYVKGDDWGCAYAGHPMEERKDEQAVIVQPLMPMIVMRTADGRLVPWLCSQTDLLANDYEILK